MGALSDIFGLSGGPEDAAAQQQAPQGGAKDWTSFLQDPRARSALLSFGLQAMTGGYGNGVQQLGAALGAGVQGAAGTAKAIQDQAFAEKELAQRASEGAATRAQSEKNARIAADSRNEVAQIRSEARLQAAAMTMRPQNSQEMKVYSDAANQYLRAEKANQLLSRKTDDQIRAEADAVGLERLRGAREATGVRSQGAPLPGNGEGASTNSPVGGGPAGQGGGPGPAGTGNATSNMTLDQMMNNKQFGSQFRIDLQSPEGQAKILKANPALKPLVDEWNARNAPLQGSALGNFFSGVVQDYKNAADPNRFNK